MDQPDDEAQPGPADCHSPGCRRGAVVYLAGRPLCSEHYLQNLNELNQLGLTPRGLSEDRPAPGEQIPERRIRESVEGPASERAKRERKLRD